MIVLDGMAAAAAGGLHHPVVTLGVFDGVHIGHRFVLEHVVSLARERLSQSVVVTFARHPRALITGSAPMLLTALPHRLKLFEQLGLDVTVVLPFNDELRHMKPTVFAQRLFHETLGAAHVVLGYNNRFGAGGCGDFATLKAVGERCGFTAQELAEVRVGGQALSSTRIRELILAGDLESASMMLGRPFSVIGTVIHGAGRGRTLGFPTANLDLHHEVRPPRGVYGCSVTLGSVRIFGVLNIGVRPTLVSSGVVGTEWSERDAHEHVEVHLLDTQMDLYGQDLEVLFLTRLRDEQRFVDTNALSQQIAKDISDFRAWIGVRAPRS
ncbi:MAG: riboflavin biosynthesis protein RibF [Planctomycetes bacterium]|nr:riboflavin biosynthesis protein RibF [Planctomycetota bacterium]